MSFEKNINFKLKLIIISLFILLIMISFYNIEYRRAKSDILKIDDPIKMLFNNKYLQNNFPTNRLYILFSLSDCPLCLYEAEFWGKTALELDNDIEIIGITNEINASNLDQFRQEYKLYFPILNNSAIFNDIIVFLKKNGYKTKTPIKLFINNKNELFAIENGVKNLELQEDFNLRIKNVFGAN